MMGVFHLFTLPYIRQNIPLLHALLSLFNATKMCFVIGGEDLYFIANDVALILGLPNKGEVFDFQVLPHGSMKKHMLRDHLNNLAMDASHPMNLRLDFLIRYILCCFFFPLKTYDLPKCLLEFSRYEDFSKYNWPQAIHRYLHGQLPKLSKKVKCNNHDIGAGYIAGCSIVLVIWILEHTKYYEVPYPDIRPRICRYFEKTRIFFEACKYLSLAVNCKVLKVMTDITTLEAELLINENKVCEKSHKFYKRRSKVPSYPVLPSSSATSPLAKKSKRELIEQIKSFEKHVGYFFKKYELSCSTPTHFAASTPENVSPSSCPSSHPSSPMKQNNSPIPKSSISLPHDTIAAKKNIAHHLESFNIKQNSADAGSEAETSAVRQEAISTFFILVLHWGPAQIIGVFLLGI
ncbi:hypothetical protein KSP39_PZI006805 [Platanthera zijinensis]|uniref:Aminotransferase-like plant mobile domain-containing protein n=1 Tax=Platanthera zijinensis TaxID=2320716 RepID=A0AAP0BQ58_9ASPA